MAGVGRYAKITARPGTGDELAEMLLGVAGGLQDSPGCRLYVINRTPGEADVVWVTELWRSQEDLEAALDSDEARAGMPAVLELVEPGGFERIDVEPIGGVGYPVGATGHAIVNLEDVEDMAPKFGFGDVGEARFARAALGAVATGLSLQRMAPGARQAFGHEHGIDEEIYVVIEGSGQVAIDDEVHPVGKLDAIRVAPGSTRAFEAGPDGLEILATGGHRPDDARMQMGYWPDEPAA
ncbi:MAG TPA: antibiotic biosynthesis monooxygenase [Solirubrobacteraceae bacterium]|jgi:quinol monooxygenase YgiN/quercetin dioxygenase-like cupin family protein|nr:antibiotic biosynthesis monooxygenase [Solirubrobacteraceae bacterium]